MHNSTIQKGDPLRFMFLLCIAGLAILAIGLFVLPNGHADGSSQSQGLQVPSIDAVPANDAIIDDGWRPRTPEDEPAETLIPRRHLAAIPTCSCCTDCWAITAAWDEGGPLRESIEQKYEVIFYPTEYHAHVAITTDRNSVPIPGPFKEPANPLENLHAALMARPEPINLGSRRLIE